MQTKVGRNKKGRRSRRPFIFDSVARMPRPAQRRDDGLFQI
jgi:hypothetical protein